MRARVWFGALLIGALVLRLATVGRLPLSGDEAYHWEWSRHLAGAYYDHPGMTAWCIWLATTLLPGGGELSVRLPAIVGSLVAAVLAYGFARDVVRTLRPDAAGAMVDRAGFLAAALITIMPLPAAFAVYMSTDAPLLPVCLALAWAAFAAAQRGGAGAWMALGAALGVAFSTKLLVVPLAAAAAAWFVLSPPGRRHLRRKGPWLALAVASLAATPLWWWNATHDWMTFRFNFEIRQRDQVASLLNPFEFLGGQLGVLTPGIAVLALVAAWRGVGSSAVGVRLVAWMCLLTLAAFLATSLRRPIGVHWTMPAWGIAIVLIASQVAMAEAWTRATWARWAWRTSWGLGVAIMVAVHAIALAPEWVGRQRIFGDQPARVMRPMFGWHEVGRAVDAQVDAVGRTQQAMGEARGVFIAAEQYGVAAAIAFYAPSRPAVHLWSDSRHGRNYEFWDDWAALAGQDMILVSKRPVPESVAVALAARFAALDPVLELPIVEAGEIVNQFYLIVARRFDGQRPFPPL